MEDTELDTDTPSLQGTPGTEPSAVIRGRASDWLEIPSTLKPKDGDFQEDVPSSRTGERMHLRELVIGKAGTHTGVCIFPFQLGKITFAIYNEAMIF